MPSVAELLERECTTVDLEPGNFERLIRRRDRVRRNRRLSAGALAILVALVSFAALTRAFRAVERPADEPSPKPPGIFSEVGGWVTYGWRSNPPSTPTGARQEPRGDQQGIWAVDPSQPGELGNRIQLSTERGTPLAWSSDGSKLLILSYEPPRATEPLRLFVLNADGTETTLATSRDWWWHGSSYSSSGGSFSPDGSRVIYAAQPEGTGLSAIYVVDTQGGTPQVLLSGGRRVYQAIGRSVRSWLSNPTYSPDGTQIAYFDHQFDGPSQLRVMNADGTGVRVLLDGTGYRMYNLAWSPDGKRLAFGGGYRGSDGVFVVGADGSGPTLVIPGGLDPYWSPDGTRIAYRIPQTAPVDCLSCVLGTLEIADLDGTHVQEFGSAEPGPWNPLVQSEPEVADVPATSEGLTLTSILLPLGALMTLVGGAALIRRWKRNTRGA